MPNNHAIGCRGTGRSHKRYAATHKPCAQHPQIVRPAPTNLTPSPNDPFTQQPQAFILHSTRKPRAHRTRGDLHTGPLPRNRGQAAVGGKQAARQVRQRLTAGIRAAPLRAWWWEAGAALL